jgi:hypothetical protein
VLLGPVVVLALLVPAIATAQDDPPGRVARLNYSQGSISLQPGGEGDWITATPNRPLVSGDNLWADQGSCAELHVGSTAIRMNENTSITLLEVGDHVLQIRLALGSLVLHVRHLYDNDVVEIDTPNLAFTALRNGDYRLDVNSEGDETLATIRHGRGEVVGGGDSYDVLAGQRARFFGEEPLTYDIEQAGQEDDFDNWAAARDEHEDRAATADYVSREMTGYEDLDDYGNWTYAANYGWVWAPAAVVPGWAPYRFGHWVWIAPWGWTWVDNAPWGFAPFHYGRWVYVSGGWAWVPGPIVVRPVYAPALVVFVGGAGFHPSRGGPAVAWFPLAPGEVYVPMHHASPAYVNRVNITNTTVNVTRITNVYNYYNSNNTANTTQITYVNQHVVNAITAVPRDAFVNGRPVGAQNLTLAPREIEQAALLHAPAVQPVRASVLGGGTPTRVVPPPAVASRPVLTNRPAAAPQSAFAPSGPGNGLHGEAAVPNPSQGTPSARAERQVPRPPQAGAPGPVTAESTRQPAPADVSQAAPSTHPLVRPVPPVQPKTQQQWSDQESKFKKWEQQRQQSNQHKSEQRSGESREEKKAEKSVGR